MENKTLIIIFKDNYLTEFMHQTKMFKKDRVMLYDVIPLEMMPDYDFDKTIKILKKSIGDLSISPIAIYEKNSNKGWFDSSIKEISDNSRWSVFTDFLKINGFFLDEKIDK